MNDIVHDRLKAVLLSSEDDLSVRCNEVYYKTLKKEVPPKSREMTLNHFVEKPIEIDILVKQIKSELD